MCQCQGQLVPTEFHTLADGPAGIRETLKHMRDQVRADKMRGDLRHVAQMAVMRAGVPGKDFIGEVDAVFNFVRRRIRYSLDTNGVEVVQAPHVTLQLGYGDCDDMSVLLACLLEQLGHVCYFCALAFDQAPNFSHVMVLCVPAGEGPPIALDATEPHPMGWFPPGSSFAMIAGIDVD